MARGWRAASARFIPSMASSALVAVCTPWAGSKLSRISKERARAVAAGTPTAVCQAPQNGTQMATSRAFELGWLGRGRHGEGAWPGFGPEAGLATRGSRVVVQGGASDPR